jgi:DNA polymerase III epsilon subunit family exonuclease
MTGASDTAIHNAAPTRRITDIDWIALDLEATGVAWGHDRIVEVGAVRFRLNALGQVIPGPRFHALVNPGQPIPEVVARITGIDDNAVRGAPPIAEIWKDLESFLGDATVIAHGARSDLNWLGAEALRLGATPLRAHFFCTLDLARKAVHGAPRYTLTALANHLALAHDQADFHRALADALHTRNLFARCAILVGASNLGDLGWSAPLPWPRPEAYQVDVPVRLQPLIALVHSQDRCHIVYRGGSAGRAPRPVTPLGFFATDGVTYLRAWCHLEDSGKSFRCERILSVILTPQP